MSETTLTEETAPSGYINSFAISNMPDKSALKIKNKKGEDYLQVRIYEDDKGQKHVNIVMVTTGHFGFQIAKYEFIDGILVKIGNPY